MYYVILFPGHLSTAGGFYKKGKVALGFSRRGRAREVLSARWAPRCINGCSALFSMPVVGVHGGGLELIGTLLPWCWADRRPLLILNFACCWR